MGSILNSVNGRHFVTASYDGLIRVFDSSQALTHTVSGHTAPITSVCVVSLSSNSSTDESTLASASHDMTVHLSSVSLSSSSRPSQQPQKCRTLATLHLHTSPLSSVAASPSGTHLLTAGWDALVGFWDTQIPSSDEVPTEVEERSLKKRRRVAESSEDGAPKRKSPSAVLKSHTGRVMAAIFEAQNEKRAYSCGLDSTIRCWDLEGGVCINTLVRLLPCISAKSLTDSFLLSDGTRKAVPFYHPPTVIILTPRRGIYRSHSYHIRYTVTFLPEDLIHDHNNRCIPFPSHHTCGSRSVA